VNLLCDLDSVCFLNEYILKYKSDTISDYNYIVYAMLKVALGIDNLKI